MTVALTAVPVAGARETDSAPETAPTTDLIGGGVGADSVRAAGGAAAVRDEAAARTTRVEALPDAVRVAAEPDAVRVAAAEGVLRHTVDLPPGGTWRAAFSCVVTETEGDGFPAVAPGAVTGRAPNCAAPTAGSTGFSTRSLGDLERLLLSDRRAPGRPVPRRRFPVVPHPVRARRAVGRADAAAARHGPRGGHPARPGRAGRAGASTRRPRSSPARSCTRCAARRVGRLPLPPVYYGTVDATPLWVILLHDAWRWGMRPPEVARAAAARRSGAGMAARRTATRTATDCSNTSTPPATGLANQGWKDSGDSIRWRDGRLAEAPIALCEVQAYAYEAAVAGARCCAPSAGRAPSAGSSGPAGCAPLPGDASGSRTRRAAYPAVALDARQAPGRLGHVRLRAPARHGPARRRGERAARGPARRSPAGLGLRPAHAEHGLGGVQPVRLPHRFGLAARHGDRRARPGPRRLPRGGRVAGARDSSPRRRGVRGPAARAVRRSRHRPRRRPRALPGRVPPAGVVRGVGRHAAHGRARTRRRTCRPARCASTPRGGSRRRSARPDRTAGGGRSRSRYSVDASGRVRVDAPDDADGARRGPLRPAPRRHVLAPAPALGLPHPPGAPLPLPRTPHRPTSTARTRTRTMPLMDLPLDELRRYLPEREEPTTSTPSGRTRSQRRGGRPPADVHAVRRLPDRSGRPTT